MAELGHTHDPRALVPGNPEAIRDTVAAFHRYGDALVAAGQGLRTVDDGGWQGAAGDGFRAAFDGEPERWVQCGDAFARAAGALNTYAYVLTWAQGQAVEAIHLHAEAEAATEAAQAQHQAAVQHAQQQALAATLSGMPTVAPDIPFRDPGQEMRAAAHGMLRRAREQVLAAGDDAERLVGSARDLAPPKPKWWQSVGEFLGEIGKGAWEATVELGEFVWSISSVRMITDPVGYANTVATLIQGAAFAVQHPTEFGKAVIDWDTWRSSPGRAIGHLIPDLVLAAATAGGGAAVRGARGVKAVDNLGDVAKKADQGPGLLPVGGQRLQHLDPAVRQTVDETIGRAREGKKVFPGHDGKPFANRDGSLPEKPSGYYQEWTAAEPGAKRGEHRVIIGGDPKNPDMIYYWDHGSGYTRILP